MKINDLDEKLAHYNAHDSHNNALKSVTKRRKLRDIPKNRNGFEKSETDPYQTDLYENSFVGFKKQAMGAKKQFTAVNSETKEEVGYFTPVFNKKRTDKTPFIKVFTETTTWLDIMPPITRVLFYFLKQLEYKKNTVRISRAKCIKEAKICMRTLDNSIVGLIEGGCIKETGEKNVYWINPVYFYKGDRLDQIDEANAAVEAKRVRKEIDKSTKRKA